MPPGQMTLARTPEGPASLAMVWVSPRRPHLAAHREPRNAMPSRPAVPEMLTMLPRFCSIITLSAALQQRKIALRLTLRTWSHSSSVISCTSTMGPRKPTLLTRMSRLPQRSTTSATIRST